MPIIKCPNCFKEYKLKPIFSGKTGKCTKCGEKFIVNFEKIVDNSIKEIELKKENKIIESKSEIESNIIEEKEKVKKQEKGSRKLFILILLNVFLIISQVLYLLFNNIGDVLFVILFFIIPLISNLYILFMVYRQKNINLNKLIILIVINFILNILLVIFSLIILIQHKYFFSTILGILYLLNSLTYLIYIYKKLDIDYKNIFIKLLKFFKWIFLVILVGFTILLISIYISSLNSYKESDFNIPKDFFNTKYGDKDPYSDENGFNDLVDFVDFLEGKTGYFDIESKCIFDKKYIEEGKCVRDRKHYLNDIKHKTIIDYLKKYFNDINEKEIVGNLNYISSFIERIEKSENYLITSSNDFISKNSSNTIPKAYIDKYFEGVAYFENNKEEIIEEDFNKFRNIVNINKLKYKKISRREYILQIPEYSGIYTGNNIYGGGKTLVYTPLIQYSRGLRYVVYKNFEEGNYEKGIQILLNHQTFIDNLMNKTDSDLINMLVYFTISRMNLETIEYFIKNYELSNELNNQIKVILKNDLDEGLVVNSLKREHIINRTAFQYLYDSAFDKNNYIYNGNIFSYYKGIIEAKLFFSVEESEILTDKIMYDVISTGKGSEFYNEHTKNINKFGNNYFDLNINNYIGRILISGVSTIYSSQIQKEKDIRDLRDNILNDLK